ncbi:MAG TPA: efflux RND transporter periplasmic adaptor subunit [Candidatus Saccharimonadales bacterium]|jgi:RND family efflux transporter MFP subunit|nr:efflux RND transporter periplasmic adaptor subunit [Candidatus Saccharimonadales bacterium]
MNSLENSPTQTPETKEQVSPIAPLGQEGGKSPINLRRIGGVLAVLIVVGFIIGFIPRWHQRAVVRAETLDLATPTVRVVSPTPSDSPGGLLLPAEVRPLVEAPIFARANGYLKRWLVDIGAHVEAGQLIAEIDIPDLDQQLDQARAQLAESDAALALAKTTADRWADLLKTSSVSEQENAEKQADFKLKTATVEADRANVHRLEQLVSFARITAPFAGTITARNTDVGDLIVAGSSKELFRLAQTETLRVYVRVPQTASQGIAAGQLADVLIPEMPGRTFPAKVVTTSGAMSTDSRTLLTELQVDNTKNEILPGSYAQVRFVDRAPTAALTLPSNTLLFRAQGLQVGVVGSDGKVDLHSVQIGRDFGQKVEVLSGVSASDQVIVNPSDSLVSGTTVRLAEAPKALASK